MDEPDVGDPITTDTLQLDIGQIRALLADGHE
jgi:hypothetical protein